MKSELKNTKKNILLKITGEIFSITSGTSGILNLDFARQLANQIKKLSSSYNFSIVIGGGNFIRGTQLTEISSNIAHSMGMLATMINGLILQDIFNKIKIKNCLFSALECPEIGLTISPQSLIKAQEENTCLIFTGGTGNPYFTTDTNAVLRALQVNATEIWKGTKVDGIYDKDPKKYPEAKFLSSLTYNYALKNNLNIMDKSALSIAKQHKLKIRVFNIFDTDALIKAANNSTYGSIIQE